MPPSASTDGAARAEPNGLPLELCRVATEEGKAKFSKKFAIDKQAQKVSGKNLTVIDDEGETEQTNTGNQGAGNNPPSGELEG